MFFVQFVSPSHTESHNRIDESTDLFHKHHNSFHINTIKLQLFLNIPAKLDATSPHSKDSLSEKPVTGSIAPFPGACYRLP